MSHVSIPLIHGGRVSLPAPFTGQYGVDTNDISDCVWTFTFVQGLIKELYRENTFYFFWVSREGHNEQTLSFSTND